MFGLAMLANVIFAIAIFSAVILVEKLRNSGIFHIICIFGAIFIFHWFLVASEAKDLFSFGFTMIAAMVLVLFYVPFLIFLISHYLTGLWQELMSYTSIKPLKTYSKAEAAAAEGRLEEALEKFKEYALKDPQDPYPHRRMADINLKLGNLEESILCFKLAAGLTPEEDRKINSYLRICDILTENTHYPKRAIEELEAAKKLFSNQKYRDILEGRIKKVREMSDAERNNS